VIDFHCHLDLYPDPFAVAQTCRSHDLYVLSVTTTPSAWDKSRTLSEDGDRIRVALGLHPQLAHERKGELPLFDNLVRKTKYVGEIGLDGGPEHRPFQRDQMLVFDHILASCEKDGGKILSIHSRRATTQVIERLLVHPTAGVPILHWFSGSAGELERAIKANCWFSVGALMLSTKKGRLLVSRMPRDRVLTETDGPFAQVAAWSPCSAPRSRFER
jgi:TatD DNase family protein